MTRRSSDSLIWQCLCHFFFNFFTGTVKMLNDILCDKFLLSKCIGKGTFSKILVAKCLHLDVEEDVQEDKLVAIKMQKTSASNMSVFRWEGEVLASLSGISCVPTVHYSGK